MSDAAAPPPTALFRSIVSQAIAEDLGQGDVSTRSLFTEPIPAVGSIMAEEPDGLILAGLSLAIEVFLQVDSDLAYSSFFEDGDRVKAGEKVMTMSGDGRALLKAERTALNFLQRLSGIATLTAKFCEAVAGTGVHILDTRKTTPSLRILEKWAVRLGGGRNQRFGLGDGLLIKDNHIALTDGDIAKACRLARERAPHGLRIEVEVTTPDEAWAALKGKADIILLDNMDLPSLKKAIELVKGRVLIEVSGGITLENVRDIAAMGPDFISIGALTHSAPAINLSMDIMKQ